MKEEILNKLRETLTNNIDSKLSVELATGIFSICTEYAAQIEKQEEKDKEE